MPGRTWSAGLLAAGGSALALAPLVGGLRWLGLFGYYEYLVFLAPPALAFGTHGLYRACADAYSLAGRLGTGLLGVGVLLFAPLAADGAFIYYTLPQGIVAIGIAVVGALLAEAGTVGIAYDAWRTGVPSERLALWLPLALPATAVTNYLAFVGGLYYVDKNYFAGAFGLAWIALGYHLWRSTPSASGDRPA